MSRAHYVSLDHRSLRRASRSEQNDGSSTRDRSATLTAAGGERSEIATVPLPCPSRSRHLRSGSRRPRRHASGAVPTLGSAESLRLANPCRRSCPDRCLRHAAAFGWNVSRRRRATGTFRRSRPLLQRSPGIGNAAARSGSSADRDQASRSSGGRPWRAASAEPESALPDVPRGDPCECRARRDPDGSAFNHYVKQPSRDPCTGSVGMIARLRLPRTGCRTPF